MPRNQLTNEERARRRQIFEALLPDLRTVTWLQGYCLAVHGTMSRDLDCLLVPWIDHAAPAEHVVGALAECVGDEYVLEFPPTEKPHGRRAWTIMLRGMDGGSQGLPFLDVSVMPRQ